jgi:hypothetical protein
MGQNQYRKTDFYKTLAMKESIKFALLQFGLSSTLFLIEYFFVPGAYYGESLLLIWMYILNLVLGIALFPIFYTFTARFPFKGKTSSIVGYFILVLLIINIVPFVTEHIFYTGKLIGSIITEKHLQLNLIFELVNPIFAFVISLFLVARTKLWFSGQNANHTD